MFCYILNSVMRWHFKGLLLLYSIFVVSVDGNMRNSLRSEFVHVSMYMLFVHACEGEFI